MTDKKPDRTAENQRQRRIKYGANVAVAVLAAVLLAIMLGYIAQRSARKIGLWADMTRAGIHSLKPQSVNILKSLDQKVHLVALYHEPDKQLQTAGFQDYRQTVSDLLDEYARKNSLITTDVIDPLKEPAKIDALIQEITRKYGGEQVRQYEAILKAFPPVAEDVKALAAVENPLQQSLPVDKIQNPEQQRLVQTALNTANQIPRMLQQVQEAADNAYHGRIPDYQGAARTIRDNLQYLSRAISRMSGDLSGIKNDTAVPAEIRQYIEGAQPRFAQIQDRIDKFLAGMRELGELRQLDDFRSSLRGQPILVLGEKDLRAVPFEQVWRAPENVHTLDPSSPPPLRFAGEQSLSAAIMSLAASSRPKVVFVRPSGPPLTDLPDPYGSGGIVTDLAQRLRDANFQVFEKDLSGQWYEQAMTMARSGRRMPPEDEPSMDDIKDAVWVCVSYLPAQISEDTPNLLAPALAQHLKDGGSALVLAGPTCDDLHTALADWGVELRTDMALVHEAIAAPPGTSLSSLDDLQRLPFVFFLSAYGDHPLTRALKSLASVHVRPAPVIAHQVAAHKVTPILPIPRQPPSWAEHDLRSIDEGTMTFSAGQDVQQDLPNTQQSPLYMGAVSESDGGGRLVVLGSLGFVTDQLVNLPDEELRKQNVYSPRFPGNAELFTSCIYWLANMESMLAISPAAMEVPRIKAMSDAALAGWRWGVLVTAMPLAVVAVGMIVYLRRRD